MIVCSQLSALMCLVAFPGTGIILERASYDVAQEKFLHSAVDDSQ
jgi:hypothetical protein